MLRCNINKESCQPVLSPLTTRHALHDEGARKEQRQKASPTKDVVHKGQGMNSLMLRQLALLCENCAKQYIASQVL